MRNIMFAYLAQADTYCGIARYEEEGWGAVAITGKSSTKIAPLTLYQSPVEGSVLYSNYDYSLVCLTNRASSVADELPVLQWIM